MSNEDGVADEFVRLARRSGAPSGGHHNRNFALPLTVRMAQLIGSEPGTQVLVRVPRTDAVPVVIRTWPDEAQLLRSLQGLLPHTPRCLAATATATVLNYVAGSPQSALCPDGKPVDDVYVEDLARLLTQTASVRRKSLPPLPSCWPHDDMDSRGYLRTMAWMADRQIRQPSWSAYGGLFSALGVPEDVLDRFAERVPAMTCRPYGLLHGDLHRDNVVVTDHGDPRLIAVDWELATYGDPLHNLAVHLIRMRYPQSQRESVIASWATAAEAVEPAAIHGLAADLPHYIAFEQAQSVFSDVIRAAKSLRRNRREKGPDDSLLHEAAKTAHRTMQAGAGPLGLRTTPDAAKVRRALRQWHRSRWHRLP